MSRSIEAKGNSSSGAAQEESKGAQVFSSASSLLNLASRNQ